MADTVAVVARRVDEHEEHLCALQHAVDAQQRVLSGVEEKHKKFQQRISELEHAVFDAQGCSILADFHRRFKSLEDNVQFSCRPFALVGAVQRELAVAEELGRLRHKVECLDEDALTMINDPAN